MKLLQEVLGWWALALSISVLLPQIWKTWKTKEIKGLSLWMYIQLVLACSLFIIKAYLDKAYFFIISYSVTGLSALIMIYLIYDYRSRNTRGRIPTSPNLEETQDTIFAGKPKSLSAEEEVYRRRYERMLRAEEKKFLRGFGGKGNTKADTQKRTRDRYAHVLGDQRAVRCDCGHDTFGISKDDGDKKSSLHETQHKKGTRPNKLQKRDKRGVGTPRQQNNRKKIDKYIEEHIKRQAAQSDLV